MINRPFRKAMLPYRKAGLKATCFLKGLTLLVLAISVLAFASDDNTSKIQAKVTEVNLDRRALYIGETSFLWDQNTIFCDAKGNPITIDRVKPDSWVYIAYDFNKRTDKRIGRKVYLLPRHIEKKEQHLYPFME